MSTQDIINNAAVIATFLASLAALLTAFVTFRIASATQASVEEARKTSLLTVLNRLDEEFRPYLDIDLQLRPGGVWYPGSKYYEEISAADWEMIESYMGLFERVQSYIEFKIIDISTIDALYGYKLYNIIRNPTIYQTKLVPHSEAWTEFIKLWSALVDHRKKIKADSRLNDPLVTRYDSWVAK